MNKQGEKRPIKRIEDIPIKIIEDISIKIIKDIPIKLIEAEMHNNRINGNKWLLNNNEDDIFKE